jgi:hypothetical protein
MELLERLNELYGNISALLNACKTKFSEIENERFEKSRGDSLKESVVRETNKQLKEAVNFFFDEYEKLKTMLDEKEQSVERIDRIPAGSHTMGTEKQDNETEALRRIEGILERQEFIGKLERLQDDEVINLYQSTLAKAERLRKSLTDKFNSGELPLEDAERILRLDANVRLSMMMEDSEYPVTGRRPLQDRLSRMVYAARQNRSQEQTDTNLKRTAEQLHSSVCFLLRDLSESSLKIRNWEETESILADPSDRQVEFFLSQSEKFLSSGRTIKISQPDNDDIAVDGQLTTEIQQ